MSKPINGFTKQKILEVLQARKFPGRAISDERGDCAYKTEDGNKCGVGMFIPDGHKAESYHGSYLEVIAYYPDLLAFMPLDHVGMGELQFAHDSSPNAKKAMLDWVNENVEND